MTRIIGIPQPVRPVENGGRSGIQQTTIHPPNLTDASVKGVYNAAARVPSAAIETLNRVSTRIGAPALSGGKAATVQHMPSGGGGDPRPYIASLPGFARAGIARTRILVSGWSARLRRLPRSY